MELKKFKQSLYNSLIITKFINSLAKNNKTQKLENYFFRSLHIIKFKTNLNPLIIFLYILNEFKPYLVLKSLRLGSTLYKIPVPLVLRKQLFKAIKFLLYELALSKHKGSIKSRLIYEFSLILSGKHSFQHTSKSFYKSASNARSFIHYR